MNNIKLLPSERTFKLWEYQVSHGNLLVRSPKAPASGGTPERTTNLDIVFSGVEYMALPRIIRGVDVVLAKPEEVEVLSMLIGHPLSLESVKIMCSGTLRFPIVAASVSVTENNWDIFESPFEFRSQFRNLRTCSDSPPS